MTNDLDHALIALRVSRDHGHGAVLNDAEVPALLAEIDRLRARLEMVPEHPIDGIEARDATIRLQDAEIDRLTRERNEARAALRQIAAIQDRPTGGDWDEIAEARSIARAALAQIEQEERP